MDCGGGAPADYEPPKTIYERFVRWSRLGVFNWIFSPLAGQAGAPDTLMINATHLKARPHRISPAQKSSLFPDLSGAQRAVLI